MKSFDITADFGGGNIIVEKTENDTVYIRPDLRDTTQEWFYWAFCVKNAAGKTLTFHFGNRNTVGYFGPCVSHDLKSFSWLGKFEGENRFTYTFAPDENEVYFSHDILYRPERFFEFAKVNKIDVKTLCKTEKNRELPYFAFGEGEKKILLTARHHACESTGNYVLEGVVAQLLQKPMKGFEVLCVPFVDYDGVIDGDQGKSRAPHDHARDYNPDENPIYSGTAALRRYLETNKVVYAFDFHSPWHLGGENDKCFFVPKTNKNKEIFERFCCLFEDEITPSAFKYKCKNNHPLGYTWNNPDSPTLSHYALSFAHNIIACTLETAYFGEKDNAFSPEAARETGKCLTKALTKFDEAL